MTILALQAAPLVLMLASRIAALDRRFLHALDDFAEPRTRHAVPEWQLRKARCEVKRYRRLMHANHKAPVGPTRTGR